MTNKDLINRLTDTIALLGIPGVGRGRYGRLVKKFGSPANALSASMSQLETVPSISKSVATAIKESYDPEQARKTADRVMDLGWTVSFPGDTEYPETLARTPEAPPVLFRTGIPFSPDERSIAIVGTRRCTESGKRFAYSLAKDLTKSGVTVVSGMADGIDSAAHQGALDAGGRTIAVWGTSLDIVYPKTNRQLAENIASHGAIYSEYFPGTEPDRAFFPERNRIIAGLSDGVVVIEAGEKSGALITADYALEYGRELFAMPGPPTSQKSIGANRLIKKGARLLTSVEDIFEELPRLKGQVAARRFKKLPDMTEAEQKMVDQLSEGPVQIDQLSRDIGLPVSGTMEVLLALELKGLVQELSGKRYILSE